MSFLGGGFRMITQPFRPFLAGTKVTQYVMTKNQQKDKEKEESRQNIRTMIKDGLALSPPPTPVDLCAQTKLTAATINSKLAEVRSPTSPGFSYDGFTFTTDVSELFNFDAPTSPPESDVDPSEVSVIHDVTDDARVPTGTSYVTENSNPGYISAELAEAAIKAVQSEPGLGPAITSVLKTGSVTPLVKEELRCTIQTKRLAKGKAELNLKQDKKTTIEELSPEEEEKRSRRRERNKLAAQKCRDKKHVLAQELTEETEFLEKSNDNLRSEVQRLEEEIFSLRSMMLRHDKSVQCGVGMISTPATPPSSLSTSTNQQTKTRPKTATSRPSKRQRTM